MLRHGTRRRVHEFEEDEAENEQDEPQQQAPWQSDEHPERPEHDLKKEHHSPLRAEYGDLLLGGLGRLVPSTTSADPPEARMSVEHLRRERVMRPTGCQLDAF